MGRLQLLCLLTVVVLVLLAAVAEAKKGGLAATKAKTGRNKGKKAKKMKKTARLAEEEDDPTVASVAKPDEQFSSTNDTDAPSENFRKNIERYMPDPSDPDVVKTLRCSSCAAIAQELHSRMTRVHAAALAKGIRGGARDYDFVDVFDQTCKEINTEWGFKVEKETVIPQYVPKTAARFHVRSGWVASMIRDRCAEITDSYEQQLMRLGRGKKDVQEWAELLCVVLEKSCSQVVEEPSASAPVPADEPEL